MRIPFSIFSKVLASLLTDNTLLKQRPVINYICIHVNKEYSSHLCTTPIIPCRTKAFLLGMNYALLCPFPINHTHLSFPISFYLSMARKCRWLGNNAEDKILSTFDVFSSLIFSVFHGQNKFDSTWGCPFCSSYKGCSKLHWNDC